MRGKSRLRCRPKKGGDEKGFAQMADKCEEIFKGFMPVTTLR